MSGAGAQAASAATAPSAKLVRIGSAPVLPAGTQPVAFASSSEKLRVTVALKPRNARALAAYASAVDTPSSPDYGDFLTTRQFAARFGPSTRTITEVQEGLRRAGLAPGRLEANHLSLSVSANAAAYERGLHLQLAHVLLPDKREALVNIEAPALPAGIAGDVQAIVGLDGLATWHSSLARQSTTGASTSRSAASTSRSAASISRSAASTSHTAHATGHQTPEACTAAATTASQQGAYTANQIASAYRFNQLYADGDEGAGVSIGVYELEPDATSDISAYQDCYGTSTAVSYDEVDGGAGSGAGSGEAAFDIEQIIGLAPKANVVVYQGPNSNSDNPGSGPYDIFAAMISQDKVSVISNSWGECEAQEGATDARAENTLFEEAAVQGQSVLSAAGDDGAEDCYGATQTPDDALAVDDPGSQPFVTDVGGTSMTALGPSPTEVTWNSGGSALSAFGISQGAGAGGGGISSLWSMPAYQATAPASLNVANANSSGSPCGLSSGDCREVPDVSADADPAHGYLIYYNGDRSEYGQPSGWQATGGTSGAAPLWAAVLAETDADSACGGIPIGFANPALYAAAASGESTYFQDVTSGNNDFTGTNKGLYPAGAGYDMATGLGSPNVLTLSTELCTESLRLSAPTSFQSYAGVARTLSIKTAAPSGDSVTLSASGLPKGVSFDAATGAISGTPTVAGTYIVKIGALDSSGAVRAASFVWNVANHPSFSHLSLTGVAGATPVLTLRLTSGKAEAPLSAVTLTLPAGLSLANGSKIVLKSLTSNTTIGRTVSGGGRTVKIALKSSASPLYVDFAAGSLKATAALERSAAKRKRPTLALAAITVDATTATSAVRGSLKPTT